MSNKKFTNEEINLLSMNKYVLRVNQKSITYSNEFKMHFIAEYSKGKTTRVIFEESGFDIDILGEDRIRSAGNRWRSAYKTNGVTGKVLLTDITYMPYGNNQMAYLSTIKDGSTNEILAYNVSNKITLDIQYIS